jgi:hypothetical protein
MFFINATVDEDPKRDWSPPPTRVANPSPLAWVCASGGWSVNVGGGGRLPLNEPEDCEACERDACEDA